MILKLFKIYFNIYIYIYIYIYIKKMLNYWQNLIDKTLSVNKI